MLRLFLLLLPLLRPASLQQTDCPNVLPRGEVACYWDGGDDAPLRALDPCKCSLLVVRGTGFSAGYQLHSAVDYDLLKSLKAKNTYLRTVISFGGDSVKSTIFEEVTSSKKGIANFTEEITAFVKANDFDGVEIDWQWPGQNGGSKDKDDLTRLVKDLHASFELLKETSSHNVERRNADDVSETTTVAATSSSTSTTIQTTTTSSSTISPSSSTTTSTPSATSSSIESGHAPAPETINTGLDLTSLLGDFMHYAMGTAYPEDDSEHINATQTPGVESSTVGQDEQEDYYSPSSDDGSLPSVKISTSVSSSSSSISSSVASEEPSSGWTWPLEESPKARDRSQKLIMMRLPQRPEYLVKGYDLKRLASIVDLFSIGTDNLITTGPTEGYQTYHHARLMGVADIENADSQVDLVNGLGVPLDRMLLGVPTRGLVFTLQDDDVTMPRAPALGPPIGTSYPQVCQLMTEGEWTVERDEDLTAPYAFMNHTWIAFDDPMSLKIKSKYALLRELAGVALHDLADDDWKGTCGGEAFPLLTSVWDTFSQLVRTPRKAVLESLVEDLETSESSPRASYSPAASHSRSFSTSPFKIVRIVDRNGDIRALRSNENSDFECTRQGYYRNPNDCSQFYRCVKFDQYIDDYTVFEYDCPTGLVFDDRWEVCAWPSAAPPCDGSSEIFPVPRAKNVCPGDGFFADPENCRWFFACKDYYGNGTYLQYEFRCPFGLAYDEENGICNWSWLVGSCGDAGSEPQSYQDGGVSIQPIPVNQVAGGLFGGRGGRGRGKEVGGGRKYPQGLDNDSEEKCIDCGGSSGVQIGGVGTFDPQRGIVIGYDVAQKAGLDAGYNAPSGLSQLSTGNNRLSLSKQLTPQSSSSPGSSSGSRGTQSGAIAFGSYTPPSRSTVSGSDTPQSSAKSLSDSSGNRFKGRRPQSNNGYSGSGDNQSEDSEEYSSPSASSYRPPQPQQQNYGARLSKTDSSQNAQGKYSGVEAATSSVYGLPSATQRQPSNSYKSSRQPATPPTSNYGASQSEDSDEETRFPSALSTSYGPPQSSKSTSESSDQPKIPNTPKITYGVPQKFAQQPDSNEQPRRPSALSTSYGTPEFATQSSELYEQPRRPSVPSTSYGTPQAAPLSSESYEQPRRPSAPSPSYGTPQIAAQFSESFEQPRRHSTPSTSYGTPQIAKQLSESYEQPRRPSVPSTSYGAPQAAPLSSESYEQPRRPSAPSPSYGAPQVAAQSSESFEQPRRPSTPSTSYGTPQIAKQLSESNEQPRRPSVPSTSYGTPQAAPLSSESYEQPRRPSAPSPSYGTPQIAAQSSESFEQPRRPSTPSTSYGTPQNAAQSSGSFEQPRRPATPLASYGIPQTQASESSNQPRRPSVPSTSYGTPQIGAQSSKSNEQSRLPSAPSTSYGVPQTSAGESSSLKQNTIPAAPSTSYGTPTDVQVLSVTYGQPEVPSVPSTSYGIPQEGRQTSSIGAVPSSSTSYSPPSTIGAQISDSNLPSYGGNHPSVSSSFSSSGGKQISKETVYGDSQVGSVDGPISTYSYPEPDVPFNPKNSQKNTKESSYTYIEPHISTFPEPPPPYGLENIEPPSDEKYDKTMYGDNVQSSKSFSGQTSVGQTFTRPRYQQEMPASIFIRVEDVSNEAKSLQAGDSSGSSQQSGYSYGEPARPFNPFAPTTSFDDSKKQSYSSSNNNDDYSQVIVTPAPAQYTSRAASTYTRRPTTQYTTAPTPSYTTTKKQEYRPRPSATTSRPQSAGNNGYSYSAPGNTFNPFQSNLGEKDTYDSSKDSSDERSAVISTSSHFSLPTSTRGNNSNKKEVSDKYEAPRTTTRSKSSDTQTSQVTYSRNSDESSREEEKSGGYSYSAPSAGKTFNPFESLKKDASREGISYQSRVTTKSNDKSSESVRVYSNAGSSSTKFTGSDSDSDSRDFKQKTTYPSSVTSHFGTVASASKFSQSNKEQSEERTHSHLVGSAIYSTSSRETSLGKQTYAKDSDESSAGSGYNYQSPAKPFNPFKSSSASAGKSSSSEERQDSKSFRGYGSDKSQKDSISGATASHFGLSSSGNQKQLSTYDKNNSVKSKDSNSYSRTEQTTSRQYASADSKDSGERSTNGNEEASSHFGLGASAGGRKQESNSRLYGSGQSDDSDKSNSYSKFGSLTSSGRQSGSGSYQSSTDDSGESETSSRYDNEKSEEIKDKTSYTNAGSVSHFGGNSGKRKQNVGSTNYGKDQSNDSNERDSNSNAGASGHFSIGSSGSGKQKTVSQQYGQAQTEGNAGQTSYSSKPDSDESDSDKEYNYATPTQSFNPFASSKSASEEDGSSSGSRKYSGGQSSERNSHSSGGSLVNFGTSSSGAGKKSGSKRNGKDESGKLDESASYSNSGASSHFGITAASGQKEAGRSGQYGNAQFKENSSERHRETSESSASFGTTSNSGSYTGTGAGVRNRKKISASKSSSKASFSSGSTTTSSVRKYESTGTENQGGVGSYAGTNSETSRSSATSSGVSHFQASSHSSSQLSGSNRSTGSGNQSGKEGSDTGFYGDSSGSSKGSSSSTASKIYSSSSHGSGFQGSSDNDGRGSNGGGHFSGISSSSPGKKSQTGYGSNDNTGERKSSSKPNNSGLSSTDSNTGSKSPSKQTYGNEVGKQSGSSGSAGHFGGSVTSPTNSYRQPQTKGPLTTPNISPYGKQFANPISLGVRVPVNEGPSLVAKLGGYEKKTSRKGPQKFGPGGFRDFDDSLGPEVCERAGLFRHPDSCDKFYECYWDRWVEKFTLHVFDCPVTIVYDSGITACNWPFNGPPCTDKRHA